MKRWVAIIACVLVVGSAGAVTKEEAERAGRVADAPVLARIIAEGNPDIVNWFGRGLQLAQMDMTADVEALVVQHFDDPRTGERLRALPVRYRTRALFDLHHARMAKAYKLNDPSIGEILNTDLDGIEEDLLMLSAKLPKGDWGINGYVSFVARRRHPAAIPLLLAALGDSFDTGQRGWNVVFEGLLAYPSVDVWKKTALELDKQRAAGRMTEEQHRLARAKVDAQLANAKAKLEEMRDRYAGETYTRRVRHLPVNRGQLEALKASDPAAYVREQDRVLALKEAIARELDAPIVNRYLGHEVFELALFARFRARDPAAAVRAFSKAAAHGHDLAQVALADTFQFDLKDHKAAIEAYRKALAEARKPQRTDRYSLYEAPGTRVNTWWLAWLRHEIAFLQTGKPFRGPIGEAEIGGFFEVMLNKAPAVAGVFAPEFRVPNTRAITDHMGRRMGGTWSAARDQVMNIGRPTLQQRLEALPSSRIALMMAIRHASALPDPEAIVVYFARNDPGGYWTACVFGTVAYLDGLGANRQQEAAANESAELLPGMAVDDEPRPISVAAQRFMGSRGIKAAR